MRGDPMHDLELARQVRPGRTATHDQGEKYDGHDALFPADMDGERMDVEEKPGRCWPAWGPMHDGLQPSKFRHWIRCGDCGRTLSASSEGMLRLAMRKHLGET